MSNWKIGIRVSAAFAVVLAICAATSLFTYSRVANIDHQVSSVSANQYPSVVVLTKLETAVYKALAMTRDYANASSPAEKEQIVANINARREKNFEFWKQYESFPSGSEEQAAYASVKEDRQQFWVLIAEVQREGRSGNNAAVAQLIQEKLRPLADKYSDDIQAVVDMNTKGLGDGLGVVRLAVGSTKTTLLVGLGLAILLAALITIVIVRGLTVPLAKAVSALSHVAEGDLTTHLDVDTEDEIGQMADALNGAVHKLHETMLRVADSAANASSSSQQLAASSEAIASGAQEQAASLEETSASLEQISAAIRESASNANDARELASGSGCAGDARDNGMNAVTAMAEITASSAKIADIIGTVDEIAFQTNLLAVNAAVEAARAGDEGRGFAVVATEVRSLAQRSSEAAKEIKALIQDSLRKVERGSELVTRVTQLVTDIATMSAEQSTGVEQVNTAMAQMDQVTQSNSAQTEELSATAEAMAQQAQQLLALVSTFTVGATPGNGGSRSTTQAQGKKAPGSFNGAPQRSTLFGSGKKKWAKKGGAIGSTALAGAAATSSASDSNFESF